MNRRNALLLQALAAVLLSTGGFLIKIITISPLALISLRGIITSIVIGSYLFFYRRNPRFTGSFSQIGGALGLLGAQLFFVLATRQTTAATAIFIQYTAPIYVALFGAWFLGERVRRLDWLTIGVVFVGLGLFLSDTLSLQGQLGMFYGVLSGISFAWFILCLRKESQGSSVEMVLLGNLLAGLIGLPAALQSAPSSLEWVGLLFLGIFQLGIPFIMMTITTRYLTAIETILIQMLEPICNPIWVALVVGEVPSRWALLGGAVVVGAVTVRSIIAANLSMVQTNNG